MDNSFEHENEHENERENPQERPTEKQENSVFTPQYTSLYDFLNSIPLTTIFKYHDSPTNPEIHKVMYRIDEWKESDKIAIDVWNMYMAARIAEKSHDEAYMEIMEKYPGIDPARKKQIYARIVKKAKTHIPAQVPLHAITQERKKQGDTLLAEKLRGLLDLSTLDDVLYEHRDMIRDLRGRGHPDSVICKLFMDSYSFARVTSADLDSALKRKKVS